MKYIIKKLVFTFLSTLLLVPTVNADWSADEIGAITKEIQTYSESWNDDKTIKLLKGSIGSTNTSTQIITGKGAVHINIMGKSVLINGKDITGNLGKKETHGDYSPIIENPKDSNIAIGPNADINNKSYNLNITLTLTLSITLILSISLYLRHRKKKQKS